MPLLSLKLKVGSTIILLRNFNSKLCNINNRSYAKTQGYASNCFKQSKQYYRSGSIDRNGKMENGIYIHQIPLILTFRFKNLTILCQVGVKKKNIYILYYV